MKRTLPHLLSLLLSAVMSGAALLGAAAPQTAHAQSDGGKIVDEVVAVVNNSVITRKEWRDRASQIEAQFKAAGRPLPLSGDAFMRQVLERLIVDRIQTQLAAESEIRVGDAEVDRALQQIAETNKTTVQGYRVRMEQAGTPYARLREEIRQEIQIARLREREVDSRIRVFDSEIDNYLAEQGAAPAAGAVGELRIAQILVRVPENTAPQRVAELRAQAEALLRDARQAPDFVRFGESRRDPAGIVSVADLGWRGADRLPQLFVDAVAGLRDGDVAGALVQSPNGFHVLKLIERRSGKPADTALTVQTRVRHILIRITDSVGPEAAYRRILQVKERITPKTDFAELARTVSQDAAAANGGDLGWVSPGQAPREFEEAMNRLQPGQVSDPVRTDVGFHLIQVQERRQANVSIEQRREEARAVIRARKLEQAYDDWLNQLRQSAYVEYRIER